MKNLELSGGAAADLARELTDITWGARYRLSPRIKTLAFVQLGSPAHARERRLSGSLV